MLTVTMMTTTISIFVKIISKIRFFLSIHNKYSQVNNYNFLLNS